MWLFLLRSAMEMASSSLLSLSAPATCWTKMRDCLRAALYIKARSIMMPTDQADMINRITTTIFAGMPMECHILRRSQPTSPPLASCRSRRPAHIKFASITFVPPQLSTASFIGSEYDCLLAPKVTLVPGQFDFLCHEQENSN